jgi:hypothetical protein
VGGVDAHPYLHLVTVDLERLQHRTVRGRDLLGGVATLCHSGQRGGIGRRPRVRSVRRGGAEAHEQQHRHTGDEHDKGIQRQQLACLGRLFVALRDAD